MSEFHAIVVRSHPIMDLRARSAAIKHQDKARCMGRPARLWCVRRPDVRASAAAAGMPGSPAKRAGKSASRARGDAACAAACGGDAGNLQRGHGGFGAKGGVVGEPRCHHVERFAIALQHQQAVDIIFGEPRDIARIAPGGDSGAQPAVIFGRIGRADQPGPAIAANAGVRAGAHLSHRLPSELVRSGASLAGRGVPRSRSGEAQVSSPSSCRRSYRAPPRTLNIERKQNMKYRDFHRQPEFPSAHNAISNA